MSYGRLINKEERIEAEDQRFGPDGKEVDLPTELDRREKRLAKLQAARAQIEAEAAAKARKHAKNKERR
jgi:hypothetical protein